MALLAISCFVNYEKAIEKLKEKSSKDYYINEDNECICHLVEHGFIAVLKKRFDGLGKLTIIFPKPLASEVIGLLRELSASDFELGIVDNNEE